MSVWGCDKRHGMGNINDTPNGGRIDEGRKGVRGIKAAC